MRTTEILQREHDLLVRLLDLFELLVERAFRAGRIESRPVRRMMSFFELYADGLHQEKEERALFPLLVAIRGGLDGQGVERLVNEHAADRQRLANMRLHLEGATCGEPLCLDIFLTHARSYIATQRRHLDYEDEHLFPLIERTFSPAQDQAAVAGFRRVEHELGCSFEPTALTFLTALAPYQDAGPSTTAARA